MSGRDASTGWWLWLPAAAGLLAAGAAAYFLLAPAPGEAPPPPVTSPELSADEVKKQVHQFCDAYPPPETFPRWAWKKEVERGYQFFRDSSFLALQPPPIDAGIKYYEERAPGELPLPELAYASSPLGVRFEQVGVAGPPGTTPPAVSNVSLVRLSDPRRPELLACEMRWGQVMALKPWEAAP